MKQADMLEPRRSSIGKRSWGLPREMTPSPIVGNGGNAPEHIPERFRNRSGAVPEAEVAILRYIELSSALNRLAKQVVRHGRPEDRQALEAAVALHGDLALPAGLECYRVDELLAVAAVGGLR